MATFIPLQSISSLHDQAFKARQPLTTTRMLVEELRLFTGAALCPTIYTDKLGAQFRNPMMCYTLEWVLLVPESKGLGL